MKYTLPFAAIIFASSAGLVSVSAPVLSTELPGRPGFGIGPPPYPPCGPEEHSVLPERPAPRLREAPFPPSPVEIAARLSILETYIGVTPEQLSIWRAYTTALIDLFPFPPDFRPDRIGDGPAGNRSPPPPGEDAMQEIPSLFGERLAEDIIAKSESAKKLKEAASALQSVLSPAQKRKLNEFERGLLPSLHAGRPILPLLP